MNYLIPHLKYHFVSYLLHCIHIFKSTQFFTAFLVVYCITFSAKFSFQNLLNFCISNFSIPLIITTTTQSEYVINGFVCLWQILGFSYWILREASVALIILRRWHRTSQIFTSIYKSPKLGVWNVCNLQSSVTKLTANCNLTLQLI